MNAILHRGVERLARTRIVEILGGGMFAAVTAVRVPGRVVWCNYDLAREIGFDVPAWPRMTRALHQQLIDALSYRVLGPGEDADGRPTITLHADRYGGDGIAPYLGSARAAFAPWGDILLKGIGLTPLFQPHNEDDFSHSHGKALMDEAFVEALQCEAAFHFFSRTPARILAIVDQDETLEFPDGRRLAQAVLARAGLQLRPAHVLAHDALRNRWARDVFVNMTRATGQLVEHDGRPDIKSTMLRVIDDQAGAVAEQVRWRVTHGCLSTSNMLMSGGMLDLVLQTTHPRLAGIAPAEKKNPERLYFRDFEDRVRQMGKVYRALRKNMNADERGRYRAGTIDAREAMSAAYRAHLDHALLCAAGLKADASRLVRAARPEVARRFSDVLLRMADLRNPASIEEAQSLIEQHAVLHVHRLLRNFPRVFFATPDADHRRVIHRELQPIYRGNRYHVGRKRRAVTRLIREFASAFAELMSLCGEHAAECYESAAQMHESIAARAAFENIPTARLYRHSVHAQLKPAVVRYREDNDATPLADLLRERLAASARNIDALLFAQPARRVGRDACELNVRFCDGIRYATVAGAGGARRLQLQIQVRRMRDRYVTSLPHDLTLLPAWIGALRYRYTTDGGAAYDECPAVLRRDVIAFDDIRVRAPYGELAGSFHVEGTDVRLRHNDGDFRGYAYAMPDAVELRLMLAAAGEAAAQLRRALIASQ